MLFARNARTMQIPESAAFPWSDTLCRRALESGRTCTSNVAEIWADSEAAAALGIQTYVSCAVRMADGALYGTLCAASADSRQIAPDVVRVLGMFSSLIGQHVERERLVGELRAANAKLASLAMTDMLTGLPNLRAVKLELARMLARSKRDGSAVLVAFIDLVDFKQVNDQHGHEAGDRFLVAMAGRLSAGLRAGDFLARLGGDEFLAITPVSGAPDAVTGFRDSIARSTVGRFPLGDRDLEYGGARVGVVRIASGDATPDEAIVQADAAMYAVKRQRKLQAEAKARQPE